MTQEQSETIQKALDIARAAQQAYEEAQEAYEEAVSNLDDAIAISVDLRGVALRGHDVKSIVKLANKMAEDELDEFKKL
jgi:hypothetical protein